jgi:ribose transport system substrate-binding protein
MAQALKGDKSFIPANKQIIVPTLVVNKANVDEFSAKLNGLLGK